MDQNYLSLIFFSLFSLIQFGYCCKCSEILESSSNMESSLRPLINITQGNLQGLERLTANGKKFYSFKGIPYAEPPVGYLRFRDPVTKKCWSGTKDATKDGNCCPQYRQMTGELIGNEDCLYLNVYTPELPENIEQKQYPVLVHVHAGRFTMGSGNEKKFKPEMFIENDIVVVSMNYRLGIFGFLSLDIPEVPGNAAFKDQRLSLMWVRDNIHFFNGNPNNVTLLGISAGSTSVEYHLLNLKSEGLFHKASMQSGTTLTSRTRPRSPTVVLKKLADYLAILNDPKEIIYNLNKMTTKEVLEAANGSNDEELKRLGYIYTQFAPVIEKSFSGVESFITQDPLDLYRIGKFVKIPILRSFCRNEGSSFKTAFGQFMDELLNRNYTNFMSFLNVTYNNEINQKLTDLYTVMNISDLDQVSEFLSDLLFFSGIYQSTKYMTKDMNSEHFSYMFSYVGLSSKAPHTVDMNYLVHSDEKRMSETDLKMRRLLSTFFVSFIKHGNPTIDGDLLWQRSTKENSYGVMNIGNEVVEMIPFPFEDRMKYWDSLFH